MSRDPTKPSLRRRAAICLMLRIHWDALRLDHRAWLTALWSRICGKRLRARHQFARLLGHSTYAYRLWLSREQSVGSSPRSNSRPIVALVDGRGGSDRLRDTIDSLFAEGISALVVGASETPTPADAVKHIDWDREPWLLLMKPGDLVGSGAAEAYHTMITGPAAQSGVRIIYADDDLLDMKGNRYAPHFKPNWNGELFTHFDYLSGACLLRATREELEAVTACPDWISRLTARVAVQEKPLHVPRILHHRRARPRPQLPAAPMSADRDLPPVTVIVPTRNRLDLLRTCLAGVAATDYPEMDVIIVDNDSDEPEILSFLAGLDPARHRVLRHRGAFNFSAINNHAVAEARGRLLCLLNNDIEVIDSNWLKIMALQAVREDVGAVGAQLVYPDGRIQHAGVVIGMGDAAGHAHRFLRPSDEGYFRRHELPQFVSAVTAACLVVSRDRFLEVGGLDEANFAVAFNDVDLCMKLNRKGWQSFYEPRAFLIHHESVSRGLDRDPVGAARFARELASLKKIWRTDETTDPYHHPQLSRASELFVVKL